MVGAHQNLNGSRPFQGWFAIHGLALANVILPTKFEVSVRPLHYTYRYEKKQTFGCPICRQYFCQKYNNLTMVA